MAIIMNTDSLEPPRRDPDREVVQYDTRTTESAVVIRDREYQTVGSWPDDVRAQRAWSLSLVAQVAGRLFARDLETVGELLAAAEQVMTWVNGEATPSDGSAT